MPGAGRDRVAGGLAKQIFDGGRHVESEDAVPSNYRPMLTALEAWLKLQPGHVDVVDRHEVQSGDEHLNCQFLTGPSVAAG
jgi:hypothetical protein